MTITGETFQIEKVSMGTYKPHLRDLPLKWVILVQVNSSTLLDQCVCMVFNVSSSQCAAVKREGSRMSTFIAPSQKNEQLMSILALLEFVNTFSFTVQD